MHNIFHSHSVKNNVYKIVSRFGFPCIVFVVCVDCRFIGYYKYQFKAILLR